VVVLLSIAVVLAASRAAQLALALVFLCFCYMRFGLIGIVLAGLGGAPVVLISTRNAAEAAYSTLTRIFTYMNGYDALWQHPLFGVGFANYEKISFINAHNSFFQAVTETGLIGGALYLLGIYLAFKLVIGVVLWPSRQDDLEMQELRHLARTLLAMLVGVVTCVLFLSLAFDVMWLFPVGIIAAFHRAARERLPEYQLRVHGAELLAVLVCGALLPAAFLFFLTRNY
jgi:O-antigen ligase